MSVPAPVSLTCVCVCAGAAKQQINECVSNALDQQPDMDIQALYKHTAAMLPQHNVSLAPVFRGAVRAAARGWKTAAGGCGCTSTGCTMAAVATCSGMTCTILWGSVMIAPKGGRPVYCADITTGDHGCGAEGLRTRQGSLARAHRVGCAELGESWVDA